MMKPFGLYLHVPFCRSKCVYCDFPSYSHMDKWQGRVVEHMIRELDTASEKLGHRPVTTVYVGGGTPSILDPSLFLQLMKHARTVFPWSNDAEVSVEMNPGTITYDFLKAAKESGVNRVSMGAQSASDRLLRSLGRIHRAADVRDSMTKLREHGFRNINLDMMIGLPGQTLEDVLDTAECFMALDPTHISCYSLIVEEGTPMYDMVAHGSVDLPDEDLEREMYHRTAELLNNSGYRQYEISNFAKDGHACRHNLDCWNRGEYLGIGVSAASLIGHERIRNAPQISAYLADQTPETITLTEEDERFESVMLGLRLTAGLSNEEFFKRHGVRLQDVYGVTIDKLVGQGLLQWTDGHLHCTPRGADIQNEVLTEFME